MVRTVPTPRGRHLPAGRAAWMGAALTAVLAAALLSGCAASSPASKTTPSGSQITKSTGKVEVPKSGGQLKATLDPLVGRWRLEPGASRDGKAAKVEDAIGDTMILARDGTIRVPTGAENRRGTWKRLGDSLKVVLDPPPKAFNVLFTPSLTDATLTLTGPDGMVLCYRRDTISGSTGSAGAGGASAGRGAPDAGAEPEPTGATNP